MNMNKILELNYHISDEDPALNKVAKKNFLRKDESFKHLICQFHILKRT